MHWHRPQEDPGQEDWATIGARLHDAAPSSPAKRAREGFESMSPAAQHELLVDLEDELYTQHTARITSMQERGLKTGAAWWTMSEVVGTIRAVRRKIGNGTGTAIFLNTPHEAMCSCSGFSGMPMLELLN